ncbi:MAG: Holliday junction resolvase RuvX [Bacteroidales bacterium]|nr:Holliday junction resolvase RuvX [Bacteroidales bacterium]
MGRILAIDYGQKRTGIAVSDPLKLIAGGLTTVETPTLLDFLKSYMEKEEVEQIVVGHPIQTNGEDSENMKRITPFVNRLKKLYPTLPIVYFDERFTSVLAHKAMIESGISRKARQNKGLVDKISATIILEEFMMCNS